MMNDSAGGAATRLLIIEDEAKLLRAIANYLGSFEGEFDVVAIVGSGVICRLRTGSALGRPAAALAAA